VAAGINLASMGANTAYWQVRYADGEHTMIGYKSTADPTPNPADETILFRDLGRPECELLGVQYDNSWSVDAVERNYSAVSGSLSDPWFSGTGFTAGGATVRRTVGYEWDFIQPGCNHPPLTRLFAWDDGAGGFPPADAVRYTAPSGATVFSSGSMQFAYGLDSWRDGFTSTQDDRLISFMRNAMTALTAGGPPPPPPVNQDPTASFSFAPASPAPGQTVTFTDTSTDSDGTVAARAWDLDDDGSYDDGTGSTASRAFAAAGTYTVRLRATDDDGATNATSRDVVVTTTPPPPPPPANLLPNPSFEVNTANWGGYQATLAREAQAGAPDGGFVAKVTRSSGTFFTIDDGARAVPSTTAGTSYTAEAWVKAAVASSVGKGVQLKLRERTAAGAQVADVSSPTVVLSNAWQKLTLTYVTTTTGGNLGVRVSHQAAATGNAFYIDAALLRVT
jgi:PKD repeat protein